MADTETFCQICRGLDLAFYSSGTGACPPHLNLGSVHELKSRTGHCSLCALIVGLCDDLINGETLLKEKFIVLKPWEMGLEVYAEQPPESAQRQQAIFVGELNIFPAQPSSVPTTQGGRRTVSTTILKQLLNRCETSHGTACGGGADLPNNRRAVTTLLVDVQRDCLVTVDSNIDTRYVALSYVWGGVDMLLTTRDKLFDLLQKGSLAKVRDKIPQVVHDAIAVTAMMEERYLWVDCLCIVQDEPQWKHLQLSQMDSIYRHAVVTIVAMSSKDATEGLPGVGLNYRLPTTISRQGLNIMRPAPALESSLDRAVYDTRAWTLQEKVLSRRCLFFSSQIVFFRCSRGVHRETEDEPIVQMTTSNSLRRTNMVNPLSTFDTKRDVPHWFRDYEHFRFLAEDYSGRKLSYPGDVLIAFAGIEAHISGITGSAFAFGIPEAVLDLGLLSFPAEKQANPRRGPVSSIHGSAMIKAPSWSWMGWQGAVKFLAIPSGYRTAIPSFVLDGPEGRRVIPRDCKVIKCVDCESTTLATIKVASSPRPNTTDIEPPALVFTAYAVTIKATPRSRLVYNGRTETDLIADGMVVATVLEELACADEDTFDFILLSRGNRFVRDMVATSYVMLVEWKTGEMDGVMENVEGYRERIAERRAIGYFDAARFSRLPFERLVVRLI
jgi:hypothetical protein